MPRLPIIVPRSGTATISPNGVTRFWSGIVCTVSLPAERDPVGCLPAALGAPVLVERLDPGKLVGGQIGVDGGDVRLQLLDGAGAGNHAVDARLGQQPAQRC